MENFEEYKLMNGALMRKHQQALGRIYIKVQETLSGGYKVSLNLVS